jgi:hypothetical protein
MQAMRHRSRRRSRGLRSPVGSNTNLWIDEERAASPDAPRTRHKGSYKGSSGRVRDTKKPDPRVDRAEIGTAYRNRGKRPVGSD